MRVCVRRAPSDEERESVLRAVRQWMGSSECRFAQSRLSLGPSSQSDQRLATPDPGSREPEWSVTVMLWVLVLLYGLSVFIVSGWIFVWCLHVTAILNAKLNLHKKPIPPSHPSAAPAGSTVIAVDEPDLPGVSVIKPLVGSDPYLASNLDSFFCMQYPLFELLFCVNDERDSALEVVRRLMAKYPAVDAKVFVGGSKVGTNPKINNMQPGYEAAAYDLILISDSGIKSKDRLSD